MKKAIRGTLFLVVMGLLLGNGCVFYEVLGIPCPGCGVTRAWLAFLKGNIDKAFSYNALFLPLTVAVMVAAWYMFRGKRLSRAACIVLCGVAVCAFVYNLLRVFSVVQGVI